MSHPHPWCSARCRIPLSMKIKIWNVEVNKMIEVNKTENVNRMNEINKTEYQTPLMASNLLQTTHSPLHDGRLSHDPSELQVNSPTWRPSGKRWPLVQVSVNLPRLLSKVAVVLTTKGGGRQRTGKRETQAGKLIGMCASYLLEFEDKHPSN